MRTPILSAILLNFNHSFYLKERISSILNALPEDAELIIVDDASTDNSVEIINRFVHQDQRVRFHKNPCNRGPNYSSNVGLQTARGKYASFLGADDLIYPDFFLKMIRVMEKHPTIGLCCSIAAQCTNYVPGTIPSNIIARPLIDDAYKTVFFSAENIVDIFRTTDFWVAGNTVLTRTELCHKHGGFKEYLGPYSDWMLFHSIALKEGAAYLPETLSIWNHHGNNYSNISRHKQKILLKALLELINGEMKDLKPLFLRSCLLRIYLKPCLFWLLIHPQYWDFLPPWVFRYLKKHLPKTHRAIKRLLP